MPSKRSLFFYVFDKTTHRVVDAVKMAALVGYRRPNAHPRPVRMRNGVSGDDGIVRVTGDTCRVRFTRFEATRGMLRYFAF